MQLYQLEYFAMIAECKSMNKAAEKLFVTQPNLTKAMQNLEAELGYPILFRSKQGTTLTKEGEALYQHAKIMLEQKELIGQIAFQRNTRNLSIAAYPFFSISRLFSEFYNENCQRSGLSLQLEECRLRKIIERVESTAADIGILVYNSRQHRELQSMLHYKLLEINTVAQDIWYVNVGPCSPLYNSEEISIQQLIEYPAVRMPDDSFSKLTADLSIDGVKLNRVKNTLYVNDCAAILSVLQNTNAFRFGPGFSKEELARYGIRSIPIRSCQVAVCLGWIRKKDKILSKDEELFIDKLMELSNVSS